MDTAGAAVFLSVAPKTLAMWRYQKKGPEWIRFSRGCVRYRRAGSDGPDGPVWIIERLAP